MKTAISLPDSLFHAADSLAKRTGMSRSELFRTAVADYIDAHKHDQVREALDAVYSEQSSQLRRGIDADANNIPPKRKIGSAARRNLVGVAAGSTWIRSRVIEDQLWSSRAIHSTRVASTQSS